MAPASSFGLFLADVLVADHGNRSSREPRNESGRSSDSEQELERRVAASTTSARDCLRAHIVLLRSEGVGQREVASRLGVSAPSVSKWSQRFDREGLDGPRTGFVR